MQSVDPVCGVVCSELLSPCPLTGLGGMGTQERSTALPNCWELGKLGEALDSSRWLMTIT